MPVSIKCKFIVMYEDNVAKDGRAQEKGERNETVADSGARAGEIIREPEQSRKRRGRSNLRCHHSTWRPPKLTQKKKYIYIYFRKYTGKDLNFFPRTGISQAKVNIFPRMQNLYDRLDIPFPSVSGTNGFPSSAVGISCGSLAGRK